MKKMFAALAIMSLLVGTVALAAPANAQSSHGTWLFEPNGNAGSNS